MHFHAEDEIFHILEGIVTFSIDGDVFNASVGYNCGYSSRRTSRVEESFERSDPHVDLLSPGGVEEVTPKLVGLSLEELSSVVEPFGSGIVGPPIDE